jgi:2-oxoglutarate dehydrogenase E2 component (dihydrolipoamide succinyltransferase)
MPQLGETVTEGTITKWYKAVGDEVARDEPLFEVSTDKVDSEVPSPAAGTLTAILVEEGDTVEVGVTLAVIGDAAANGSGANGSGANGSGPTVTATPPTAPAAPPAATPAAPAATAPVAPVITPPVAPDPAPGGPVTADRSPSSELSGDPSPAGTGVEPPPAPRDPSGQGLVLSPVVRRLINEHGIDPSSLSGTGVGGRITRADVEAAIGRGGAPATPGASVTQAPSNGDRSTAAPPPAPTRQAVPAPAASPRDEVVAFTNIRRRTAEHMVRSKATSAHTLMVKEIDYEHVEQVRRAHGDRFMAEEGFRLSYLPFAALAAVEALADFPHLNASVGADSLIVHHDINLGIAVDLDNEGLIVPVVHNAEELNLRGMARRIRDLADRARSKRLSLDDISGGTFSITNAGPFGTLLTGAIINQPQVAILSTDGVSRKPVVVALPDGSESITIHSVGLAAMTFDHRAVDGAYVARYLARLSEILDDRDWAGEL